MQISTTELSSKSKNFYDKQQYQKLIEFLDDETLEEAKDAELYALKSRAYNRLNIIDYAYEFSTKAIEINPFLALGYIAQGEVNFKNKLYSESIKDYDQAISLENTLWEAFAGRGTCYAEINQLEKAIRDFDSAIKLDGKLAGVYYNRGLANHNLERYKEAIDDYSKAIKLNGKNETYFLSRGNAFYKSNLISKAKKDYLTAIKLNKEYYVAYLNLGILASDENKYTEAIDNFTKGISLGNVPPRAFNLRAKAYVELGKYIEAIKDYERFLTAKPDSESYSAKRAKAEIIELKRKIENSWYDELDRTVSEIKNVLLYNELCLTHFTSLSASQAMILGNSKFRLSEGNFLNDTSEGRELFKYLSYSTIDLTNDDTLAKPFIERPFIGSFVDEGKHDDLTLWRMYGKEELTEAKGCALTINREAFINALNMQLALEDLNTNVSLKKQNTAFTFFKVAYRSDLNFKIPGSSKLQEDRLNKLMKSLKSQVNALDDKINNENVAKLLNDIAYLFKTSDYHYENEVRLVVEGIGFAKKFHATSQAPRVYIDLINIIPVLHKITLGPKVDRPDEWAAAFNYKIDEFEPNREKKVEIVISRLPFK